MVSKEKTMQVQHSVFHEWLSDENATIATSYAKAKKKLVRNSHKLCVKDQTINANTSNKKYS